MERYNLKTYQSVADAVWRDGARNAAKVLKRTFLAPYNPAHLSGRAGWNGLKVPKHLKEKTMNEGMENLQEIENLKERNVELMKINAELRVELLRIKNIQEDEYLQYGLLPPRKI